MNASARSSIIKFAAVATIENDQIAAFGAYWDNANQAEFSEEIHAVGEKVEAKAAIIDRPVEDVWKFMLDISNMPRWEDGRAEWRQTSEGPITIGTTFQSSIRFLGRQFVGNLRITDFEPNRRFTVEGVDTFARGTKITYLMHAVEGGKTRLSRVTEVELHGLAKLLRPIQGTIVRRAGELEANNVKRLLEAHGERRSK